MDDQTRMLLSCMRDVGVYFSKIGEAMIKYADATASSYSLGGASPANGSAMPSSILTTTPATSTALASSPSPAPVCSAPLPSSSAPASSANLTNVANVASATPILPAGTQLVGPNMSSGGVLGKRKEDKNGKKSEGKRMRFNWTEDEDCTFIKVYNENYGLPEKELIEKLYTALGGGRTHAQCKGHLKNLQRAGKLALQPQDSGSVPMVVEKKVRPKANARMTVRMKSEK